MLARRDEWLARAARLEEPTCSSCGLTERDRDDTAFHSFWAAAEQRGLVPGMYHDDCFWKAT